MASNVQYIPNTLAAIRTKVRRITGRPSPNQLSDIDIDNYINTFYLYDFTEHLRLENLRVNYQFTTTANVSVYDFPTNLYLDNMPPVYIGGYQSYMTQSRQNYFRVNPQLNFLQQSVYTGNGTNTGYTGQFLTSTPLLQGFQRNPPGAYSSTLVNGIYQANSQANQINWNVIVSALGTPDAISGVSPSITLVDDGLGNLIDPNDPAIPPTTFPVVRGSVNYITGAISITNFQTAIPNGNAINCQYIPYVASRPQSVVFYQDQFQLYPIADQAYTVSFECYQYPTAFFNDQPLSNPQVNEWWEVIAFGAALKVFEDNGDLESYAKYRPLMEEHLRLVQRRTIVQQTSERTATIYTEQTGLNQFSFGNLFSGF